MNLFDPFLCRVYLCLALFALFVLAERGKAREEKRLEEEQKRRAAAAFDNPYHTPGA